MIAVEDIVFRAKRQLSMSLPNGDLVIYSPDGDGEPLVLSGVALEVYKRIESGTSIAAVENLYPEDPDWSLNLQAILEYFLKAGLITAEKYQKTLHKKGGYNKKALSLWIHVTDLCNLKCDYCYVCKGKRHLTEEACQYIVAAIKRDVIQSSIEVVTLKFAGGEPLIDTRIILFLCGLAKAELEPLGVKVKLSIITNGTLVTEGIALMLKEMKFDVMVSMDGLGEFNNMRKYVDGRPSIDQVIHGIDILIQAGIRPAILTTISNQNVGGLWELSEFARGRDLTLSLSISRDYDEETGLQIDLDLVGDAFCVFLDRVITLPKAELPRLSFKGIQFAGSWRTRICTAGYNYFVVDPEANVCFCPMTANKPLGSVVNGGSFLEYSRQCDNMIQGGECTECIWKNVCCGGCEALAIKAGTVGGASVHCSLMKQILPQILRYQGYRLLRKES